MRSLAPPILRQPRYAINPPLNADILAADPLSALGKTRLYPAGGREIRPAVGPPTLETAHAAQDRILGTQTGRPQTASQAADQEAFDKSFGFTPNGQKPVAAQIADRRASRLQADPYDLDYSQSEVRRALPVDAGSLAGRNLVSDTGAGSMSRRWEGAAAPVGSNILGRTTAAGVSNSQAAGFQQPTKRNPAGVTETTPIADPDKLGKRLFTGF